jgi:hypothetical protein
MKFCPVVPEICRGQVHGPRKESNLLFTNTYIVIVYLIKKLKLYIILIKHPEHSYTF